MIVLIRHGQTAWSLTGQHTGLTDIPLTDVGVEGAKRLAPYLREIKFSRILSSPLARAKDTAKFAGFEEIEIDQDLVEWDYGDTEGLTSAEMAKKIPGWSLFKNGVTNGESIQEVSSRAQTVISKIERDVDKNVLIFAHGHILRIWAACWLQQDPHFAARLVLDPCSVSMLGFEHDAKAVLRWNITDV